MTGFGEASWEGDGIRLAVEVRGVNHRFLDVRVAVPRDCQAWEPELRSLVAEHAVRGKIDVTISRSGARSGDIAVEVNEELARLTLAAWRELQKRLAVPGEVDLSFLQGRGDFVRVVEKRPDASGDLVKVRKLLLKALAQFDKARTREGAALARDMRARGSLLRSIVVALRKRTKALVPELAERLRQRLGELLAERSIEERRLLQEAALLAERADVTEELVRLDSHLDRLAATLKENGSIGKPIDFLLQEIHREFNTIASKSADIEVTQLTLAARAEVEKLREQVQNVE
jgi:uncharacterized protein (TIGR00255 family)